MAHRIVGQPKASKSELLQSIYTEQHRLGAKSRKTKMAPRVQKKQTIEQTGFWYTFIYLTKLNPKNKLLEQFDDQTND